MDGIRIYVSKTNHVVEIFSQLDIDVQVMKKIVILPLSNEQQISPKTLTEYSLRKSTVMESNKNGKCDWKNLQSSIIVRQSNSDIQRSLNYNQLLKVTWNVVTTMHVLAAWWIMLSIPSLLTNKPRLGHLLNPLRSSGLSTIA